jgi:hypothetical protein
MVRGYLSSFIDEVKSADSTKVGVQLALVCINKQIPVTDIADFFDVTRMTVYMWFRGKTNVPVKHLEKMRKLVEKLR